MGRRKIPFHRQTHELFKNDGDHQRLLPHSPQKQISSPGKWVCLDDRLPFPLEILTKIECRCWHWFFPVKSITLINGCLFSKSGILVGKAGISINAFCSLKPSFALSGHNFSRLKIAMLDPRLVVVGSDGRIQKKEQYLQRLKGGHFNHKLPLKGFTYQFDSA